MTSKVKIFSNCQKLIETLPQLLQDPKNPEKVLECSYDHWYDGAGYGLIAYHSNRTELEVTTNYSGLSEDILEDLKRATPEMRQYILARIGR